MDKNPTIYICQSVFDDIHIFQPNDRPKPPTLGILWERPIGMAR